MTEPPTLITSLRNPRVKQVVALRDRRERKRSGLMRVEGFEELSLALASGARPRDLFFCRALFRETEQQALLDLAHAAGGELTEVTEPVFHKIAYREGPDGWLATFPTLERTLADLHPRSNPFLVVAESVEKPGNLGAILRTADAAGVAAVIASAPLTDWGNPNIIRSSKGAVFSVPVAEAANAETIAWLREHGIQIVAATPQATLRHDQAALTGPLAIAVGSEKYGLSESWLEAANIAVRIPMAGRVNSLNVATAAAILIYEAVRQRTNG